MKLAICTYSLHRWRDARGEPQPREKIIDWIAQAGVEGIEFVGMEPPKGRDLLRYAASVRRRCEKAGLEVAGFCTTAELLKPKRQQAKDVAHVKRMIDVAAELGCKNMRTDISWGFPKGWRSTPKTFAQALKIIAPGVREFAEYGRERGVVTSIENHGFYMQAPERVAKLIEAVDHPWFRLTMDMGNFLCVNSDPVEAVKMLKGYAVHIHIKDFHIKPAKIAPRYGWIQTPTPIAIRGAVIGHGNVDILTQLKILKRSRYKGFLSVEFEGLEEARLGLQLSLEYLKKHMAELGMRKD